MNAPQLVKKKKTFYKINCISIFYIHMLIVQKPRLPNNKLIYILDMCQIGLGTGHSM
jgi:hypothetical protein